MGCSVSLSSYQIPECFSSRGGLSTIWIGEWKEGAYTTTSAGTVSAIDSGVTLYKIELRRNTSSLSSTLNVDENNGTSYVQTDLLVEFTKMDKEPRLIVSALSKGSFLAIAKDANGQFYALGNEESMRASAGDGNTSVDRGEKNAYTITLSDVASDWPMFLDSTAVAQLP